jgi:hypothetical protein
MSSSKPQEKAEEVVALTCRVQGEFASHTLGIEIGLRASMQRAILVHLTTAAQVNGQAKQINASCFFLVL